MNNKQDCFWDKPGPSWLIIVLILYSVLSFSLETIPDLPSALVTFLHYSEFVVVLVFTLEYATRIYKAQHPLRFVFSFYGIIDLLAILPFYLMLAIDLRALRLFRLLRLARLLKLTRYSNAIRRFSQALYSVKEELVIFSFASLIILFLASVGIYHFEHAAQPEVFTTLFDCMWWAAATLTTVGYGDIYPVTVGGKLFTFLVLMLGLGMIAVPTGIIATALSTVRQSEKN